MSKKKEITVINYDMGNVKSLFNIFNYLNTKIEITDDPNKIAKSKIAVLPGVGSFAKAMDIIKKKNIDSGIKEFLKKGNFLFCICLGMQLLGQSSNEDKFTKGLGLIKNKVSKFNYKKIKLKIPHAGFNSVNFNFKDKIFEGIKNYSDFYFIHSYRMLPEKKQNNIGITKYGEDFLSYINVDNIYATQFHPEKSQSNGIQLMKNFLKII